MKGDNIKGTRSEKFDWVHLLSTICVITTGITIVMAFWIIFDALSDGIPLEECQIPVTTLPRILLVGAVTGAGTDMIFNGSLLDRLSGRAKLIIQIAFVYAVPLFFGWLYEWYTELSGMLIMIASISGIYIFTFLINYWRQVKMAKLINEKLAQRENDEDDD